MAFQLHPTRAPTQAKPRSANAHKMDLDFLCNDFKKMEIVKPSDQTHNKVEKAQLTSEISNKVAHAKTQRSGISDGSIQKLSQKLGKMKLGYKNFTPQSSTKFKVKNQHSRSSRSKGMSGSVTRSRVSREVSDNANKQTKVSHSRDPAKPSEIYTYNPKKGFRHVCTICKRMYRFEINLLNHDIVDHHLGRAYLHLPKSREAPGSLRRATECELIQAAFSGTNSSNGSSNFGNPELWVNGEMTILNVQWARYCFDDKWTLKICLDSGMSYAKATDRMARLDVLENMDREEFEQAKQKESKENYVRKGLGWYDMKRMEETLSKRDFALWKAAVVENDLVEGMGKMMKGF